MTVPLKWQFWTVRPGVPSAEPSTYSEIAAAPQSGVPSTRERRM